MTRHFCILLYTLFALLFTVGNAGAWEGIVVKVIDGDSLRVQRNGKIHEIRLYGIDTPEYRQAYSNKAKQFTKRLAYRQVVTVEEKDIDRYGRIVALVMSQGKLVNRELVREGLAWYYPQYCLDQPLCREFQTLERKARKACEIASAQNNFLTKHLNVWVSADTAWMNMISWDFTMPGCKCPLVRKQSLGGLPLRRIFWRYRPSIGCSAAVATQNWKNRHISV